MRADKVSGQLKTLSGDRAADTGGVYTPCPPSAVRQADIKEKVSARTLLTDSLVHVGEILRYLQTDCYLDKAESAKYLGVGLRTFEGWMEQIPRYRPGGKPLFKKSELDAFMKRHQEIANVDVAAIADEVGRTVLG